MKHRKDLERTGKTLGKVKNPPKSEVDKYMQKHQSVKAFEAQKPKPTYIDNVIHKANLVTRGWTDVVTLGATNSLKEYNDRGGFKGLYGNKKIPTLHKPTASVRYELSKQYDPKER